MIKAISVSQLNGYIKKIFDAEELLHNVPVVGEVFGVSVSRNIMYFSLRDAEATLSCVCFYPALFENIKEGSEIIATGSPNFYVKGGKLSFVVNKVEASGQGKLFEEFLKMKEMLEKEGLFDPAHKKALPKTIKRIGVITSSEGAVIQDIKNVGWRRNPGLDIVLYSTRVQGKGAEVEIAHAIEVMGKYPNIDVLVVARGGGSLEDLWAYNTEIVARATYNCEKPIVSAVGHETDFTIIDFVSDLRAPTPSAAAEILTFNLIEKQEAHQKLVNKLYLSYESFISNKQITLKTNQKELVTNLERLILTKTNKFNKTLLNFDRLTTKFIEEKSYGLGLLENSLMKLNPTGLLEKGYAFIEQNGTPIKSKNSVDMGKELSIIFKDGNIIAKPINTD